MTYRPGDDEMDQRQKDEQKLAKADREQLKKDRDAQRANCARPTLLPRILFRPSPRSERLGLSGVTA